VRTTELDWCEAAGNYVRLHVGGQSHLLRETMTTLEAALNPQQFVRIHRSTIVNVERIQELQSTANGECTVFLQSGARLTMSRGYREAFQERFGKSL
jgi:two-component system LytT family response regulator